MDVAESIHLATEWVESYAVHNPDFRGAHLMGGIPSLPANAPFPPTSDLDLGIVVANTPTPGQEVFDELYRGVPIEAGLRGVDRYRSPEVVLADPDLASNLATDTVVADPYGLLHEVQPVVAAEYGRRRWVVARCEVEKQSALAALDRGGRADAPQAFLREMIFVQIFLSGLIAVAMVKPPTHRKCLVLLGDLLHGQGRDDLYEEALAIGGFGHLTRPQVVAYQQQSALAFDRAIEIRRTPSEFDFKLRPHLRPYLVDGTGVMIEEGNHREAMLMICAAIGMSMEAIQNDASAAEIAQYDRVASEPYEVLGIASHASRSEKLRKATRLKDSFFALADEIVAQLSDDIPSTAAAI